MGNVLISLDCPHWRWCLLQWELKLIPSIQYNTGGFTGTNGTILQYMIYMYIYSTVHTEICGSAHPFLPGKEPKRIQKSYHNRVFFCLHPRQFRPQDSAEKHEEFEPWHAAPPPPRYHGTGTWKQIITIALGESYTCLSQPQSAAHICWGGLRHMTLHVEHLMCLIDMYMHMYVYNVYIYIYIIIIYIFI